MQARPARSGYTCRLFILGGFLSIDGMTRVHRPDTSGRLLQFSSSDTAKSPRPASGASTNAALGRVTPKACLPHDDQPVGIDPKADGAVRE